MKRILMLFILIFLIACNNNEINDINKLVYRKRNDTNILQQAEYNYEYKITDKESLYYSYKKWKGTPYLWGGETRFGIDCSAFMQRIYEEVYKFNIPRTTVEQMDVGKNPGYQNRKTGDLIFFKTGADTFHVGVYYENDNFFHSSSTFGVTMSNLNEDYWKKTYLKIRRFID